MKNLNVNVEFDREDDGRWIADITNLPGVLAYGATKEEALAKAEALALRVLATKIEESKESFERIQVACA